MKKIVALTSALALVGCASPFFRPELSGNETHVRIGNVQNPEVALKMATGHCGKYGKTPKQTGGGAYSYLYDCVDLNEGAIAT